MSFETQIIKEKFLQYSMESHKIRPQNAVLLISPHNVRTFNVNVNGALLVKISVGFKWLHSLSDKVCQIETYAGFKA